MEILGVEWITLRCAPEAERRAVISSSRSRAQGGHLVIRERGHLACCRAEARAPRVRAFPKRVPENALDAILKEAKDLL